MNTLLDPVYIGFFGGGEVGKTCLLRRIANLCPFEEELKTDGFNYGLFQMNLKENFKIKVKIIDFSSDLLALYHPTSVKPDHQNPLSTLIPNLHCVFLVSDITSKQSLLDCSQWMDAIVHSRRYSSTPLISYILANKADLPLKDRVISLKNLDRWRKNTESVDWAFTVGHRELGDVDPRRGNAIKQKSIEDILIQLLLLVLQRRDSKYYKLLDGPPHLNFHFVSWIAVSKEEIEDQAAVILVS